MWRGRPGQTVTRNNTYSETECPVKRMIIPQRNKSYRLALSAGASVNGRWCVISFSTNKEKRNDQRVHASRITNILARETIVITPEAKDHLWSALTSLASAPRAERTLTVLSVLLQSQAGHGEEKSHKAGISQKTKRSTRIGAAFAVGRRLDKELDRQLIICCRC